MTDDRELVEGQEVHEEDKAEVGGEDVGSAPVAGRDPELGERDMELMYEESMKHIREGEIVSGKIVRIEKDVALVDIGYKSEGSIPLYEFEEGGRNLKVGDEVDVFLDNKEDSDGLVVLSKEKANRIKLWDEIERIYQSDGVIEGTVVDKTRGGLTVDIGVKAFLPGSQVDLRPVRNMERVIGQKFRMKIIKLNRRKGNIVLSRRQLLEEERAKLKAQTLSTLKEGQVLEGVVKNITHYGVFVDLGGIDGLLHITDMAWGRVGHPSEVVSVGDKIQVAVLKFDPETERVSLGRKQVLPDPWSDVDEEFPVGSTVHGKVVSLADYGAFVELKEGVEGLVHVSEMSWTRKIRHPSKVVSVGDTVEARVLNVDKEAKRISLGIKQVEENPWHVVKEKYPPGSIVEGKIRNLTDFGAFLALEEGIDGLIHISDISWSQRIKHPSEVFKKGQRVQTMVLSVDADNERLSLGVKQLSVDPWTTVSGKYWVGDNMQVEVVKLTNFGAFAELEPGVEGLIHLSELSKDRVGSPEEVLQVGDVVNAKIIKVDVESRKIGLSIRAYIEEMEEQGEEPVVLVSRAKVAEEVPAGTEAIQEEEEQPVEGEAAAPPEPEALAVVEELPAPEAAPGEPQAVEDEVSRVQPLAVQGFSADLAGGAAEDEADVSAVLAEDVADTEVEKEEEVEEPEESAQAAPERISWDEPLGRLEDEEQVEEEEPPDRS